MIELRVEIYRASAGTTVEGLDEPEGWATWAPAKRREWCTDALETMIGNMVGSSFNYPEQEEDDRREEAAAAAVKAFRAAAQLPGVSDCTSCGATDGACRDVINRTSAARSCCSTCKVTATHLGEKAGKR